MYRCSKCGKTGDDGFTNYSKFKNKAGVVFKYYLCNGCNSEKARTYRKTKTGAEASSRAIKKYEGINTVRRPAWRKAYRFSPSTSPCVVCGITERIHRHHPDISRPKDIVFLCPLHHKEAHRNMINN